MDVGYGGAFYCLIDAKQLGIELCAANAAAISAAGRAITNAGRAALHAASVTGTRGHSTLLSKIS